MPGVKESLWKSFDLQSDGLSDALCAGAGELVAALFLTPLSVVKVRMQAQKNRYIPKHKYKVTGIFDGMQKIAHHEGVGKLWSGLAVSLLLSVPTAFTFYIAYDQIHYLLRHEYGNYELLEENPLSTPVLAMAGTRLLIAWMVSPMELLKVKLQSSHTTYREVHSLVKTLVKRQGIGILWRGAVTTLTRDTVFAGSFWFVYEYFRILSLDSEYLKQAPITVFGVVLGGIAGCIAGAAAYPLDLAKTYQQSEIHRGLIRRSPSMWTVLVAIKRTVGYSGLYTGLRPRLAKIIPTCAIVMGTTESLRVQWEAIIEPPQPGDKKRKEIKV